MPVLRVDDERGPIVAAGVVALTTFAALLDARFLHAWSGGVRFVVLGLLAALVGALAVSGPAGRDAGVAPRPYRSIRCVAARGLVLLALGGLADALGAASDFGSSGTLVWVGLLLVALCAWLGRRHRAPIMTLLGALAAVVVAVAFVDWAFDPDGLGPARAILLLCAIGLTLGALALRDARRRDAVALVDAAGLAIVALALTLAVQAALGTFASSLGVGDAGGPAGWELIVLVAGFGLVAYGAVDRERVPAFIGVVVLALFVVIAAPPAAGGASLIGWPIVLGIVAAALLAAGLRPRDPIPPEPIATVSGPPLAGDPPTAATTPLRPEGSE